MGRFLKPAAASLGSWRAGVAIFLGIFILFAFFFYYMGRSSLSRGTKIDLKSEIMAYKSLGFAQDSELILLLEAAHKGAQGGQKSCDLEAIIALNKKLLHSFVKDLTALRADKKSSEKLISFTYDAVGRLTLCLADLYEQQKEGNQIAKIELEKKLSRMLELVQQSIAHSKRAIQNFLEHETSCSQDCVQKEREHLTQKVQSLVAVRELIF